MKPLYFLLFLISTSIFAQKNEINSELDSWHKAAAEANFEGYFSRMSDDSRYIGTDATENWSLSEFKAFSKPYFDKGKAWNFSAIERNIYLSSDKKTAWFDEVLDTWMGLCRGSGVLRFENGKWLIAHYVLSMAIPNDATNAVLPLKSEIEKTQKQSILKRK